MYHVEPLSPKFSDDFDRVATDSTIKKGFNITLRNKGGFQLCRQEITALIPGVDNAGKAGQLSSEGTIYCPPRDYLDATRWEVGWNPFPTLSEYKPQETPAAKPVLVKPKPR